MKTDQGKRSGKDREKEKKAKKSAAVRLLADTARIESQAGMVTERC